MRAAADPTRQSLPLDEWDDLDRKLWQAALRRGDFEDAESGLAVAWREKTRIVNQRGYGRWLTYCRRSDCPADLPPADRVTPDRVDGYLRTLKDQGLRLTSQCDYIGRLVAAMSVLAPERDWRWLKRLMMRLDKQVKAAPRSRPLTLLAGDILHQAKSALKRLEDHSHPTLPVAAEYRNWLMVDMLMLVPLRLGNFTGLSIGRTFRRINDQWQIDLPADETKTNRSISMPVSAALAPHIDHYLTQVRPVLLRGHGSDRLWISTRGRPMNDGSTYAQIVGFTQRALGAKINPHRFRHIAASSLVLASPDMIEAARALLTHGSTATTEQYYILGQSVAASRQHAELIKRLRRRSGPKRPAAEARA